MRKECIIKVAFCLLYKNRVIKYSVMARIKTRFVWHVECATHRNREGRCHQRESAAPDGNKVLRSDGKGILTKRRQSRANISRWAQMPRPHCALGSLQHKAGRCTMIGQGVMQIGLNRHICTHIGVCLYICKSSNSQYK